MWPLPLQMYLSWMYYICKALMNSVLAVQNIQTEKFTPITTCIALTYNTYPTENFPRSVHKWPSHGHNNKFGHDFVFSCYLLVLLSKRMKQCVCIIRWYLYHNIKQTDTVAIYHMKFYVITCHVVQLLWHPYQDHSNTQYFWNT